MSQDTEDRTDPPGAGDGTPPPAGSGNDDGQGPSTTDHLTAELREARQDAGKYRRQLREVQRELEELRAKADAGQGKQDDDDEAKAQLEQARTEREQLTSRLRRVSLRAAVAANANALKIVDVDTALALLDSDELEWDGDEPTEASVKDALAALLDAKPFLRVAEQPPGVAPAGTGRTGGSGGQDPPKATPAERRARLYGGGGVNPWDPEDARRKGGGVIGA